MASIMNKKARHECGDEALFMTVVSQYIPCLPDDLISLVMTYQRENKFLRFIHQNPNLSTFVVQNHDGQAMLLQRASFDTRFKLDMVFYDTLRQDDDDRRDLGVAMTTLKKDITSDEHCFWLVRKFKAENFCELFSLIQFRSILGQLTEPSLVRHEDLQFKHLSIHKTRACVAFTSQLEQSDATGDYKSDLTVFN